MSTRFSLIAIMIQESYMHAHTPVYVCVYIPIHVHTNMLGTHTHVGLPTPSYARFIIHYHATLPSVLCIAEQV